MMLPSCYFYGRRTIFDSDALFSVTSLAEETIENVQVFFTPIEKALDGLDTWYRRC
jgi:hypothetical protein